MKKLIVRCMALMFIFCLGSTISNAQEIRENTGLLAINGTEAKAENAVLLPNLVQLRAVVQGIGGTELAWNDAGRYVEFIYDGSRYRGDVEDCSCGGDYRIDFSRENAESGRYEPMQLNVLNVPECCYIIDDMIYLTTNSCKNLLKEFGFKVELDLQNNLVTVDTDEQAANWNYTTIINGNVIQNEAISVNFWTLGGIYFQLRGVIEALGGEIMCEQNTLKIKVGETNYRGTLDEIKPIACGCDIQFNISFDRIDPATEEYQPVLLFPMGHGGQYLIVDDHIYLSGEAMEYLLKDMGYTMMIDTVASTITIQQN